MKKVCAGLLVLLLLMPTLSVKDDELKIGDLLLKLDFHQDSFKKSDAGSKDHARYKLDLPDHVYDLVFERARALRFDDSAPLALPSHPTFAQNCVACDAGRAPPLV